jgi:CHASE3 domain sensor protein
MIRRARKPLRVFARGASLRRRVAYSLAVVRLILVPVIFLAIYYLFRMGWIVDRIVNVDAQVGSQAQQASIEMMDARRAERNYFLRRDPIDSKANRQATSNLKRIIAVCRSLQPEESSTTDAMARQVSRYEQQFANAASRMGGPEGAEPDRIHKVVRAYEHDLNGLLRRDTHESRTHLIDDLRDQVDSFDAQITETLEAEDPSLRDTAIELQDSSNDLLRLASELELRSGNRVKQDHREARRLMHRAEWVLGTVSALTLILSIVVSFILPREVVKPMVDLKKAVDHAAAGNYEIEFQLQGQGEVVQLANSVRNLIAHVRERRSNGNSASSVPTYADLGGSRRG